MTVHSTSDVFRRLAMAFAGAVSVAAGMSAASEAVAQPTGPDWTKAAIIQPTLECFREKCAAVFPKEARPNKELGSFFDSIKSGTTLAPSQPMPSTKHDERAQPVAVQLRTLDLTTLDPSAFGDWEPEARVSSLAPPRRKR